MQDKTITNLTPPPFWASANEQAVYRKAELEAGNKRMAESAKNIKIEPSSKKITDRFVNSNFGMGF